MWTLRLSLYYIAMFSSLPLKEMCFSDWRRNDSESRLFMLLFFLLSDESKHILIVYRDSIRLGRDKSDFGIEPPTPIPLQDHSRHNSNPGKGRVTASLTLWMFLRRYLNMHSLKYGTTHVRQLMFIFTSKCSQILPSSLNPTAALLVRTFPWLQWHHWCVRTAALTSIGPNLKPVKENIDTIWRMLI